MSFFTKKVGCCCCVCFPKIFVGIFYILSIQQYWRSSIYTTTQLLQPVPAFLADLFMFFLRSRATAAAIHSASKLLDTQYRLHSTFVYSILMLYYILFGKLQYTRMHYIYRKRKPTQYFSFFISSNFEFQLMNALFYVNIDRVIR